jgi:hypothetical protein
MKKFEDSSGVAQGRRRGILLTTLLLLTVMAPLVGCSGHPGTPFGTFPVTVIGTSGTVSQGTSFT